MNLIFKNLRFLALFLSFALIIQGCTEDDDADGVQMIEAAFTHIIDQDNGVVTFINTSENADNYHWDFGDGTSSTEINPVHVYPTGTYTVILTATNAAGATDTFEDVITLNVPVLVSAPFNFDQPNIIYSPFVNPDAQFNGATFSIVANPAPGGSNDVASQVGAITNVGSDWEGIFFDLLQPIDLEMDMTIQMDMWSDTPVEVLMKLENGADFTEIRANHGGTGWENLIFTFNSVNEFTRLVLFIGPGAQVPGTFYIDNIRQTSTIDTTPPVITLIGDSTVTLSAGDSYTDAGATAMDNIDMDITSSIVVGGDTVDTNTPGTYVITYDVMDAAGNAATQVIRTVIVEPCSDTNNLETPIEFDCPTIDYTGKIVGNVNFMVVENPAPGGSNDMASMVGQITNVGANWENAFFNLDTPLDFAAGNSIRMDLWSDQALPIKLKFEDGTGAPVEVDANHGGTGWEELTFMFTSMDSYNDMVVFVDGPGTAAGTFYIDNIEQFNEDNGGGGSGDQSPYCQTAVTHLGIPAETASEILLSVYNVDSETMRIEIESTNDDPVDLLVLPAGDFNPVPGISMAPADQGDGVWAAEFFYPGGAPDTAELFILWSKASFGGNWQFGGPGDALFSVPFDATCDGSGGSGGGGGGTDPFDDGLLTNGDFESGQDPWQFRIQEDRGTMALVTENDDTYVEINVTNPDPGNIWKVNLSQVLNVEDGGDFTFKFDAWAPVERSIVAGVGRDGNPDFANVAEQVNLTTTRTTYEFNFTAVPGAPDGRVLFDFAGEAGVVYIDNVALFLDSSGGGGGGGGGSTGGCTDTLIDAQAFPVDFEGCETFLSHFGDNITVGLADNPDQSGINTSNYALKIDKPAGSEFWEGTQNNFPTTFPDISTRKFTMKIWSSKPNTTFRFEVAQDSPDIGNPPGAFATVTEANTWTEVEVVFDAIPAPDAYFRFVIKPDNDPDNSAITSDGTYYIDDINLVSQ